MLCLAAQNWDSRSICVVVFFSVTLPAPVKLFRGAEKGYTVGFGGVGTNVCPFLYVACCSSGSPYSSVGWIGRTHKARDRAVCKGRERPRRWDTHQQLCNCLAGPHLVHM